MSKFVSEDIALTFNDVLIVPGYSPFLSRSDTDPTTQLGMWSFATPLIAANMDKICGYDMAVAMQQLGGLGIIHRSLSLAQYSEIIKKKDLYPLAMAVGSVHSDKERIDMCVDGGVHIICIDIAHGDSIHMLDTIQYIKGLCYTGTIVAGNVCTAEGARFLSESGADVVKVGVGPGSVCSTRTKTGCGYPQLQAILNVAETGIPFIADGGIKTPGDAAKALVGGADMIMIGGMLAGTDKVPGWDINKKTISFRGMASLEARADVGGKISNQEGIATSVERLEEGSTARVISEIKEGIRSAMSYTGSKSIADLRCAKFVKVSNSVQSENIPHIHK